MNVLRAIESDLNRIDLEFIELSNFFGIKQVAIGNNAGTLKLNIKRVDFFRYVTNDVKSKERLSSIPCEREMTDILVTLYKMDAVLQVGMAGCATLSGITRTTSL